MSNADGLAWIATAINDLEIAESLFASKHYNATAFYAHQSAEKSLKGLLRLHGHIAWGHNCLVLLQQTASLVDEPVPTALHDAVNRLARHYIPSRYPDAFATGTPHSHYTETIAQQALTDARSVLSFVQGNKP